MLVPAAVQGKSMGTPLSGDCNARRWALPSFDLRWPRWRLCKPRARALGIAMAHFQYFGRLICTFAVPGHLSGAGWRSPAGWRLQVLGELACKRFLCRRL